MRSAGMDAPRVRVNGIGGKSPQEQGLFIGVRVGTSPGRAVRAPRLRADRAVNSPGPKPRTLAPTRACSTPPSRRRRSPGQPHLTRARPRARAHLRGWPEPQPLEDATIPLAELALVRSTLAEHGPFYTTLATLRLGGQSADRR